MSHLSTNENLSKRQTESAKFVTHIRKILSKHIREFHSRIVQMRSIRTNLRTHNNSCKQTFEKKEIHFFELFKCRNRRSSIFEVNVTRKEIFSNSHLRQKNSVYFIFLKKTMQKNRHSFQIVHNMTFENKRTDENCQRKLENVFTRLRKLQTKQLSRLLIDCRVRS